MKVKKTTIIVASMKTKEISVSSLKTKETVIITLIFVEGSNAPSHYLFFFF